MKNNQYFQFQSSKASSSERKACTTAQDRTVAVINDRKKLVGMVKPFQRRSMYHA
jgi:hypothetical protein